MRFTDEQERIFASSSRSMIINAFAGCGKTTTLAEYARRRPRERFLYLAFNRAIKQEAERKFPKNVRCVTTHGLAFPKFGVKYKDKLGNPKAFHLAEVMQIDMVSAGKILDVVNRFLVSSDREIGERHVKLAGINLPRNIQVAIEYANTAWKHMQREDNPAIPMPHDGYLKLFATSDPEIRTDCILFDEAQDANPVTIDIVRQQSCRKVIVGDRHQGIYGFRGAVNAMRMFEAEETHALTQSFRFGSGIASLATRLLSDWAKEDRHLTGSGPHQTVWAVDRSDPYTILARTNAGLFDIAVGLLGGKQRFGYVGGVDGYKMDMILDAYYLWRGDRAKIRDRSLASFQDWKDASIYAEQLDDRELKVLIGVVENHGRSIPSLIDRIKREAVSNPDEAAIMLSTAHKAKGMEWDSVVLSNDFQPIEAHYDKALGRMVPPPQEEINLLYVAMTRALRALEPNDALLGWLRANNHMDLLANIRSALPQRQSTSTSEPPPSAQPETEMVDTDLLALRLSSGEGKLCPAEVDYLLTAMRHLRGQSPIIQHEHEIRDALSRIIRYLTDDPSPQGQWLGSLANALYTRVFNR